MTFKITYCYKTANGRRLTDVKYVVPAALECHVDKIKKRGYRILKVSAVKEVNLRAKAKGGCFVGFGG